MRDDLNAAHLLRLVSAFTGSITTDNGTNRAFPVMDDAKFFRLLHINEELIEMCKRLNENTDPALASNIRSISDELTLLVLELSVEK